MTDYTLDTNILVLMQRVMPRDIFPGVWDAVEAMAHAHQACMCQMVWDELDNGTDNLSTWAKGFPNFVCAHDASELTTVAAISAHHPGWVQNTKNEADPWVIAHAKHENRIVVTQETQAGLNVADRNQKIPNVASEHNVPTIDFIELARAEGWSFN